MRDYALAATMTEAMRIAEQMTADGCTPQERRVYIENVLRQAWPHTRAWVYYCESCGDTGWRLLLCDGSRRCGRDFPHTAHDYVTPCDCRAGQAKQPKAAEPSVEEAGVKPKARPFTRVGR